MMKPSSGVSDAPDASTRTLTREERRLPFESRGRLTAKKRR
jgi:hypothetical protein